MFPIRDHNPSSQTPYVTYGLIGVNVVVFVLTWQMDDSRLQLLFMTFGMIPSEVMSGHSLFSVVSYMFLHGGWMHLLGNMLFLWIFGDNMEDAMGHRRFGLFYLGAGLCAAALQIMADPGSPWPMVGASGAIAGVLGGYLLLYPRARVDVLFIFIIFFRIFAIPAWVVLGVWFGLQIISSGADDGVAYMAHIGGFLGGLALTFPVWRAKGGWAFWAASAGAPRHPATSSSSIPRVPRK